MHHGQPMHLQAVPNPKLLSTGMLPLRSGQPQNLNWWAALNPNGRQDHHRLDHQPDKIQGQGLPDRP